MRNSTAAVFLANKVFIANLSSSIMNVRMNGYSGVQVQKPSGVLADGSKINFNVSEFRLQSEIHINSDQSSVTGTWNNSQKVHLCYFLYTFLLHTVSIVIVLLHVILVLYFM